MNSIGAEGRHVYELSLLQFRPDATSEELLNIGVVAYSPDGRAFRFKITHRYKRVKDAFPFLDGRTFARLTYAIQSRCSAIAREIQSDALKLFGDRYLQEIMDLVVSRGSENFRWSTIRYGTCTNLETRVDEVYYEYIGRLEVHHKRERLDDDGLWRRVTSIPAVREILPVLKPEVEVTNDDLAYKFSAGWMNGKQQVVEAISFDYEKPADIIVRAIKSGGIVNFLRQSNDFGYTALISDPPLTSGAKQYDSARTILTTNPNIRQVIQESDVARLVSIIESDTRR